MPRIIRTLAVSGAAAAALLGTAGAASADSPGQTASVAAAAVGQAAGAPVTLPSGRTLSVRGLDAAAYRADAPHHTAVVTLAADSGPGMEGIDSSLNEADSGSGAGIEQPSGIGQGVSSNPQQQVQTQAGAGAISGTAVAALVLGIVVFFLVKKSGLRLSWAVACVALGVLLSPTFIGPLVGSIAGSGTSAFGNIWAGF